MRLSISTSNTKSLKNIQDNNNGVHPVLTIQAKTRFFFDKSLQNRKQTTNDIFK